MKVSSDWTYQGSFWARTTGSTPSTVTASLVSTQGSTFFASATVSGLGNQWKEFKFSFKPNKSATNIKNAFRIDVNGASGDTYFAMFSLMPPTYKNMLVLLSFFPIGSEND